MTADGPVRIEVSEGGAYWTLTLVGGKGHILDRALMDALGDAVSRAVADPHVKVICLAGEGPHFSFGASVAEHMPEAVHAMLGRFHALILQMLDSPIVTLAAVRGQCLGGALELVCCCHRVFSAADAHYGQPEIVLGVFAPVASVILPERVGRGPAEDLCVSGRSIDAAEAHRIGLVDELADDPVAAATAYARAYLLPRSASSLRFAVRATRRSLHSRVQHALAPIERLYLDELMQTDDAVEGLRAFLEKRPPSWRDR